MSASERRTDQIEATRRIVFGRAGYRCEVCGGNINRYDTPQLAHRIPQTVANVGKYGEDILHHPLNLAATCGLRCNSAVDIRNHPREIAELVARIKEEKEKAA